MKPLSPSTVSLQNLGATGIALCLLAFTPLAHAEKMGRLFFTPEQRTQLDYAYARNAKGGTSSPVFTVNGIVQKQGGPRTVWVNGLSQDESSHTERNPIAQTVNIPGKSKPLKLKVGDKILLDQSTPAGPNPSTE